MGISRKGARVDGLGNTDFSEVFRPRPVGEPINVHVVPAIPEPAPDYAAMQRLIEGGDPSKGPEKGDK